MSKVSIITAGEAAALVGDNMTVTTSGFVASDMPEALSKALEQRFLETGSPRDLTLFYAAAQGNRGRQRSRPLCARGNDETRDRGPLEHGSAIGPHGAGKQD